MNDLDKSKDQLLDELKNLRQRVSEIEESDEKLQMMKFTVDHAMEPLVWIAPDGSYLYVNDAGCKHVKHLREQMLSMRVSDLDPNYPPKKWREHFKELKKAGSMNLQTHHIGGDGKKIYVDLRSNYIKFGDHEFICSYGRDITRLKETEEDLKEQMGFERLIAEIAANLGQAETHNLEHTIDSTLEALGRFLHTERAFLGRFSQDRKRLTFTNMWAAEGFSLRSEIFKMEMVSQIPWVAQQILSGRVIQAGPGLSWLPKAAQEFRRQLERDGINSGIAVPVHVAGKSVGILGLDTLVKPREYSQSIVDRLKIVADTVGSILHRVQVQTKLQESERRFRAFMDNLPAHAYIKDNSDRHLFANKTTLDYLGRQLDEFIGLKSNDLWPEAVSKKIKHLDPVISG